MHRAAGEHRESFSWLHDRLRFGPKEARVTCVGLRRAGINRLRGLLRRCIRGGVSATDALGGLHAAETELQHSTGLL